MILAALIDATRGRNYSILNTQGIQREMNKVADKFAKQARQASINLVKL